MKERLKELDQQTDLINDHVLRMKEIKSTKQDDEVLCECPFFHFPLSNFSSSLSAVSLSLSLS